MANRLVYADGVWCLTVDGKQIPNTKVIYNGLKMLPYDVPTVEIIIDELDIAGLEVVDGSETFGDGVNGAR